MKKFLVAFLSFSLLSACASKKDDTSMLSAEQIYTKAYHQLKETKYEKAGEDFEKIETEHPYSKWAVKSKLMAAYAYYQAAKYDDAILALNRFIKYHPGNKDIAYAYYLRAICYYDQIAPAEKSQSITVQAHDALNEVILLFPDTPYAADASQKLKLVIDHEAAHEMHIGRYYLRDKNYLSALNRFDTVVQKYQTTAHIEEALYREVEIFTILGLTHDAERVAKVLQLNYPDSNWNAKAQRLIK